MVGLMQPKSNGFTIVELLIVIVVIGILAAISLVAYNGVQVRARDADRKQDVKTIVKALEMYYTDRGHYPNATTYTPGSTTINSSWSTTSDSSWANLLTQLAPYINKLPSPPGTATATPAISVGNNYDYFGLPTGSYCGVAPGQDYLLVYLLEGSQVNTFEGTCASNPAGPYASASNYRMVK
jgi:prepilin-type N-terminal cleavage/methylation domain-containing protein